MFILPRLLIPHVNGGWMLESIIHRTGHELHMLMLLFTLFSCHGRLHSTLHKASCNQLWLEAFSSWLVNMHFSFIIWLDLIHGVNALWASCSASFQLPLFILAIISIVQKILNSIRKHEHQMTQVFIISVFRPSWMVLILFKIFYTILIKSRMYIGN